MGDSWRDEAISKTMGWIRDEIESERHLKLQGFWRVEARWLAILGEKGPEMVGTRGDFHHSVRSRGISAGDERAARRFAAIATQKLQWWLQNRDLIFGMTIGVLPVCQSCGYIGTIAELKSRHPTVLSCCPERRV